MCATSLVFGKVKRGEGLCFLSLEWSYYERFGAEETECLGEKHEECVCVFLRVRRRRVCALCVVSSSSFLVVESFS